MRDIKFRAWHKKLKCWGKPCIGVDFDKLEPSFGLGVRYLNFHNKEIDELPTALSSEKVDILDAQDRIIIMQYTGLKDKNGKEIYEGDIVKVNISITGEDFRIGVVKFGISDVGVSDPYYCPTALGFYIDYVKEKYTDILGNADSGTESKDLEVIGNMYDDKELLED